ALFLMDDQGAGSVRSVRQTTGACLGLALLRGLGRGSVHHCIDLHNRLVPRAADAINIAPPTSFLATHCHHDSMLQYPSSSVKVTVAGWTGFFSTFPGRMLLG